MDKLLLLLLTGVVIIRSEFPADQECPEECDCHYFRVNYVTDCSESNLTEIPYDEISLNVYILDMNGNEITDIQPFPEDIKVRRLQLAENKLTTLTGDMFTNLKYLLDIDLSSNNISTVDPNAFRDSHGLITIELQGNPLLPISSGPFLKCRSLLYLDISSCNLTHLNDEFFTEIPLLTHLDLSENPLKEISEAVFKPLISLEELNLRKCNLTRLVPNLLIHQTHLKLLDLSENKLINVDWAPIFGNTPRLETLNLRKTNLRNLPDDVFVNNSFLRFLTLSDNELSDLDIGTTLGQNLVNLHSLDLSNCNMTGPLDEYSFVNATSLKVLNLAHNHLTSKDLTIALSPLKKITNLSLRNCSLLRLPENIFDKLTTLKELDLSWNPLNNVFAEILEPLSHLEFLNMGYSKLEKLSNDTFIKTTNIRRLILSGNKLGELETGLFKNLRHLETLEIENCGLEKAIDEDVFYNKTYGELQELKMSGNPLRISEGSLIPEQLSKLKVLDLSNCSISYLPDESFENTKNLTRLLLSNNKLNSDFMNATKFLDILTKLEYLDLSGNNLTKLSTCVISKTNMKDIKLTNNPWICDCTLAEWWNWAYERGDITHLIGSTLTLEDIMKKGNKRKKGLLCRFDSKITPPTRKNVTVTVKKMRMRVETANRTWARYLKESNCPIRKVTTQQKSELHHFFPEPILPSPQPELYTFPEYDDETETETGLSTVAISSTSVAIIIFAAMIFGIYIKLGPKITRSNKVVEIGMK